MTIKLAKREQTQLTMFNGIDSSVGDLDDFIKSNK